MTLEEMILKLFEEKNNWDLLEISMRIPTVHSTRMVELELQRLVIEKKLTKAQGAWKVYFKPS